MDKLTPEQIQGYVELAMPIVKGAVIALLIFVIGRWFAGKAQKVVMDQLRARELDEALVRFMGNITKFTVLAATVIAALGAVGIQTTSVLAIFASAGLAVGLALQGSLANFASGVMILVFRPFSLSDKVTAGGHTGVVSDVGLFACTFMTPDNETVIIPNSQITAGSITNFTRKGTLRGGIAVGVAYGSDLKQVQELCIAAAKKSSVVLAEPAPAIAFVEMGASSLNFTLMPWCEAADYLDMLHEVRSNVYNALNEAGIDIPYDQIVVHQASDS